MSIFTKTKPSLSLDTREFVDNLEAQDAPPMYTLSPQDARQVLLDAQSHPTKRPDAEIIDQEWPVGPTGNLPVRIVKPKGAKDRLPAILYLHGGGWVLGDKNTHDRLIRVLACETGAAVVFPDFSPSPEAVYPTALEECYAALVYMGQNAAKLGFDPDGFVVAGDSAGGNLATVIAMLAKERGGPRIVQQTLFYPVTDADFETGSYKEFSDGPWLTRKAMQWFWDAYLPDVDKRKEKNASPMQAFEGDLAGMPPTLVITAENDVLRDEGEAYARKLDKEGVKVACLRMNGTIHDFVMLDALAETTQAKTAIYLAVAEMKKAFQSTFPEASVRNAPRPEMAMA